MPCLSNYHIFLEKTIVQKKIYVYGLLCLILSWMAVGCSTSSRPIDPELVVGLRGVISPNQSVYELQEPITINYVLTNVSEKELYETVNDGSNDPNTAFAGYTFNAVAQDNRNLALSLQKDGEPFHGELKLSPGQEQVFCQNIFKANEPGIYLLSFDIRWKNDQKISFKPVNIKVKTPQVVQEIPQELRNALDQLSSPSLEERHQAREKLVAMGAVAAPHLILLLSKEKTVAIESTTALLEMGKDAMPALIQASKNPDSQIRMRVVAIIGQIGGYSAIPALSNALLHDPDKDVRIAALRMIAENNTNEIATPLLIQALPDQDVNVRQEAISKLEKMYDKTLEFKAYDTLETRQKAVEQWKNWWREQDPKAFQ